MFSVLFEVHPKPDQRDAYLGSRLRRVRIVRDCAMFDRREAPQYHPDVRRP
jgi:hypothetical protein